MVLPHKYQNKKIAIYGMGITGFSAAKAFNNLNAKVYCWDDNQKVRKKIQKLKFKIDKFWLKKNSIDKIVISPGIDIENCKLKDYLKTSSSKIITDLDLFFELNKDALIISITGTNGKSTTCKIVEKILKTAKHNVKTIGNIGNPILFEKNLKKKYTFILEVSSYQLQYSKIFRSKHAAILNISPDHLDRHKNIKNYTKIKSKIFFGQKTSDYSYINIANKYSKIIKKIFKQKNLKSKLVEVSKSDSISLLKKTNNKYLKNKANVENVSFAYQIAKNLKIKDKVIVKAINNFIGLPHRQQVIFTNKKMSCIDDSKATSFDASLQSLLNYNKIYWIVGGKPKQGDKFNLKKLKKRIVKAYIIGKSIPFFVKELKHTIPYMISKNLDNAIKNIINDMKLNDGSKNTILLSPAAASYDQFKNFEDRGNYFKNLIIKKLNV